MNITVNEIMISHIYDETGYKNEMTSFLNAVIDAELEKDNMDTALIDDCTDILYALQFGTEPDTDSVNKLLHIYKSQMNRAKRGRRIAAAVLFLLIGTGMLLQTDPAIAQQTQNLFSRIAYTLGIAANETDAGNSKIVSIYARLAENADLTVQSEDDIHPEDAEIIAVDQNDFEKAIPLSECTVNKERIDATHIMVTYSYEGCACSIIYTLEGTK